MTAVIVEPDSLSAWIGLAGVAPGGVAQYCRKLAAATVAESRNRRREFHDAADDLRAGTQTLIMMLEASERLGDKEKS